MSENVPNLKKTDNKIEEEQRALNKLNPNRPTPRHNKNGKSEREREHSEGSKRKTTRSL